MINIENVTVHGFEEAIRGMRNPMNSWDKSDSTFGDDHEYHAMIGDYSASSEIGVEIGPNDYELMLKLAQGGSTHAKYRRMIIVYMDITAPLYWWKEMDTYMVGKTQNSCSTMHKIHAKEFTLDDFSHEHLMEEEPIPRRAYSSLDMLEATVENLNAFRELFLKIRSEINKCHFNEFEKREELAKRNKEYWWQMIQLLPSSYNQRRTIMLNYENLSHIYHDRKNHKLDEWREFCNEIEMLPCASIIIV